MEALPSNPHQDRKAEVQGSAILFLILALVSFSLRIYARVRIVRCFGVDDWFMLGATVSYTFYIICCISGAVYGTGRHLADLSLHNMTLALAFWYFCYIWYLLTMILSKISIGVFLFRIVLSRGMRWLIYAAMFLSTLTGTLFFFVAILQCRPLRFFWERTIPGGQCISIDIIIDLTYIYSILNTLCDFTYALVPIWIVVKLKMPKRLKQATIPLLALGCIASIGALIRLAYVQEFRNPDFLYATVDIAIWSTVEAGLAITAGSLACIRPLLRAALHRLGLSTGEESFPLASSNNVAKYGLEGGNCRNGSTQMLTPGPSRMKRRSQMDIWGIGSILSTKNQGDDDGYSVASPATPDKAWIPEISPSMAMEETGDCSTEKNHGANVSRPSSRHRHYAPKDSSHAWAV